jgi:hypothetical protein
LFSRALIITEVLAARTSAELAAAVAIAAANAAVTAAALRVGRVAEEVGVAVETLLKASLVGAATAKGAVPRGHL